jgi:hypothetical protein
VAGEPATELTYAVRARRQDRETKLFYWVFRHEMKLFVLRAALSPKAMVEDEAALRSVVASFRFLGTPSAAERAPATP